MSDPEQPRRSTPEDLRTEEAMRHASVADAIDLLGRALVTVPASATTLEVALVLARHGQTMVPVVDGEARLVGIIRAWDIVDAVFFHVSPTEFLAELFRSGGVERFRSLTAADTAAEIMTEPVAIGVHEPLARAFHLIHQHGLDGIPVVDDRRRVVGLLDRNGILRLWVRFRSRQLAVENGE